MMKASIVGLLSIAFCSYASVTSSEDLVSWSLKKPITQDTSDATPPKKEERPDPRYRSRVQVGADYTYLYFNPHGSSNFHGNLGGAQAIYEFRPLNDIYAGANFIYKQGNTAGAANDRSILYFDTQERLGYSFDLRRWNSDLSLYSGIGYHFLGQKLSQPGLSSLRFDYNEFYIPVGFAYTYSFSTFFSLGLNGVWMPQVFGIVAIDPLDGAYWTLTRTVGNFKVEIPFGFSIDKQRRYQIFATPFFEFWEDGHSDAVTTTGIPLGLPGNTYYYTGIDVNFSYSF